VSIAYSSADRVVVDVAEGGCCRCRRKWLLQMLPKVRVDPGSLGTIHGIKFVQKQLRPRGLQRLFDERVFTYCII
jgi:hypothetical protein